MKSDESKSVGAPIEVLVPRPEPTVTVIEGWPPTGIPVTGYLIESESGAVQGPAIEDLAWDKDRSSFEIAEQYGTESEFTAAITTAACRTDALKEAMHYAAIYGQDGPVAIYEVTRRVIFPEPPQGASGNQATARSDKHESGESGVEPRPQDRQEG